MPRYARIYATFLRSSLQRELEFRANFIAKILQNAVWIVFFVLILLVIYGNTKDVAGWNRGEAFMLGASMFLMSSLSQLLFSSLGEIPSQVRQGTLDFVLTKPVDSQYWISLRRFNFDQIGSFFAGIGMMVYGVITAELAPGPAQWIAWSIMLVAALIIFYSFNLALMSTGIWFVRVDNLFILSETVSEVARYPLDIYSIFVQRVLIYGVPLGFLATLPTRQLVREFDPLHLGLSLVYALVAFIAARSFWRYALRSYSSASS
ncbi:MAG: ABC-2 family transporter protein [Fimbriimonadaceae bacterium]|nr:ABC-2 family transporter protein [Fimbriimonadaceae bacterium]